MENERTTEDLGTSRSDDAAELDTFGDKVIAFGRDIKTTAWALDGLTPDARDRVLDSTIQRCRTFGDLGHEAARAITKLKKDE